MIDIADIKASIQSKALIQDEFFKDAQFLKDLRGRLLSYTGGYTVVIPCIVNGEKWAFRCWHVPVENSKQRYSLISDAIHDAQLPFFCSFEYREKGLFVKGESLPITKMKWVEGKNLKKYICAHYHNKEVISELAQSFLKMVSSLHRKKIAHGDLQHGNILVSSTGQLFLVDYDSMYVPSMGTNYPDVICGLADYQHPCRKNNRYSSCKLDYFSEAIIYTSLLGISRRASLVEEYSVEGSEGLLFSARDFENFEQSKIYRSLLNINDPMIDRCLALLMYYLSKSDISDLVPIESAPNVSAYTARILKYRNSEDDLAWARACKLDSISSFQAYLRSYPNGRHSVEANTKIIEKAWYKACRDNSIDGYRRFIDAYPNSSFASTARLRMNDLLDQKELEAAKRTNTLKAIDEYINNHPLGKYLPDAYAFRGNLESIEKELLAWKDAATKDTLRSYHIYLKKFPNGIHANVAHKKIKELSSSYWLLVFVLCIVSIIVCIGVHVSDYSDFIDDDKQETFDGNDFKEPRYNTNGEEETIHNISNEIPESEIIALEKETETLLDGMEATKKNGKSINPDYRSRVEDNLSKLNRANSSQYLKMNKRYEAL